MKKLLFILLFVPVIAFSQTDEKNSHFQLGCGFSSGFFNPSEVNDIIDAYLTSNNMIVETGFSEIVMNLGGRVFVGYKSEINLGFEAFLEGAIGPKVIAANNGESVTFLLNRLSEGVKLTYDIQLSRRHSIIVGAGPMLSRMKFVADGDEILNGSSVGGKLSVAYQFNYKHIAPRAFIDIDFAKAKDKEVEMNYSGVEIGLAFSGIW
jgi:hypothetical protein